MNSYHRHETPSDLGLVNSVNSVNSFSDLSALHAHAHAYVAITGKPFTLFTPFTGVPTLDGTAHPHQRDKRRMGECRANTHARGTYPHSNEKGAL